jgi:hypothetical protein
VAAVSGLNAGHGSGGEGGDEGVSIALFATTTIRRRVPSGGFFLALHIQLVMPRLAAFAKATAAE